MIPAQRTGRHDDVSPYSPATLAAAIAGDRQAFAEIWQAHRGEVFAYAYARVDHRHLAEDITSETFVRALRRIGSFGEPVGGGMAGWLTTIARNLIFDHYKASRTRFEHLTSDGRMHDAERVAPGPERYVLVRLEDAALRQAISRLNDQQRDCITLRFLRGLSVAETAAALGKNEDAVKTLQYRAVRTLGRLIATDPALADAGAR